MEDGEWKRAALWMRVVSAALMLTLGLTGCVTGARLTDWIRPGVTTQDEVVDYFGPPDMVIHNPPYLTAIYRGRKAEPPKPSIPMMVPTVRGPVPMESTPREPVPPDVERHARRPPEGFRVIYDRANLVTEVQPGSPDHR